MIRFLFATILLGFSFDPIFSAVAKPICGGRTSSKNVALITPKNPPRKCNYHIQPYSSHVCQLRIDFAMTLAQPTIPIQQNGLKHAKCLNDYFYVDGLYLCGIETQQHIYVPFNRTGGIEQIDLRIVLAARIGLTDLPKPEWNIQIRQLECPSGSSLRSINLQEDLKHPEMFAITDGFFVAPTGCRQYFPELSGNFTSFNYNNSHGVYPGNLNYAICFRRTMSTKSLHLITSSFKLGSAIVESGYLGVDNDCYPQSRSEGHFINDFMMIPQATIEETGKYATYFCGDSTSKVNISSHHPGPLMVIFNSEGVLQQSQAGFAFSYKIIKKLI